MPKDNPANIDVYLLVLNRLAEALDQNHDHILSALNSIGPSGLLDDMSTSQLIGALKIFDHIIATAQYKRGQEAAEAKHL